MGRVQVRTTFTLRENGGASGFYGKRRLDQQKASTWPLQLHSAKIYLFVFDIRPCPVTQTGLILEILSFLSVGITGVSLHTHLD